MITSKPEQFETRQARRQGNAKLLAATKAFKPDTPDQIEGTCGNIQQNIWGEKYEDSLGQRVNAPFLLARLCAAFNGLQIQVGGQEDYKTTWSTVLVHIDTGYVVTFYDWKGGASLGSNVYGKDIPAEFLKDVRALVEALCDDRFPHPYDGCVVGEEA